MLTLVSQYSPTPKHSVHAGMEELVEEVDSNPAAVVDTVVAAAVHTRTVAAAGMLPAVSRQVFELAGQLPSSDSMQERLGPYPAMQKTKSKNNIYTRLFLKISIYLMFKATCAEGAFPWCHYLDNMFLMIQVSL